MGFMEKLKLLFKVRVPATDLINEVQAAKTGWKTIPFWITLIGTLLSFVAALKGIIPPTAALVVTTALTLFYNVLRGATKADVSGTKPIFQTTEFWIGVLSQVANAIVTLQTGGVNPQWLATTATIVAAAMAAGQNLAGQQPNALPATATAPATPKN